MFSVVKAQPRLPHLQLPCYFKNGCFWILFFSLYLDYFSATCLSTIQSPLGDSVDYTWKTSAVRFQLGLCCSGQIWGLEEVREGHDLQFTLELDPGNWGQLPHPHPGNLHSNHCRHIEAVRGHGLRQDGVGPSGRCAWLCSVTSVLSNSCDPHGREPTRLLCPWDSLGRKTGVDGHALLQGLFPTQRSNLHVLRLLHLRWILFHWVFWEAPLCA